MIFTSAHVRMIVRGAKTQTRRVSPRQRWFVGRRYSLQTSYSCKALGFIEIDSIRQEPLGVISTKDAMAEGGYTPDEFIGLFESLHERHGCVRSTPVWVLTFHYVGEEAPAP